ncbi:MAG: SEC-C metal-binding domain-containing protein [Nitriliruptoraceae bacterium]
MDHHAEHRLRTAAGEVLRRLGPLTVSQLADALIARDDLEAAVVPEPRELWSLLLDLPEEGEGFIAFPLADGRLCDLEQVFDGLTLTRAVDDHERGADRLELGTDLAPLLLLFDDALELPFDGDGVLWSHRGSLAGPPGWVPDAAAMQLTWTDGTCRVEALEELPAPDQRAADRLAEVHGIIRELEQAEDVVELVLEARVRYPRLLSTPGAPLSVLLEAGNLRVVDHRVLAPDEPDPEPYDPFREVEAHLRADHGLDDDEVADLRRIHTAVDALVDGLRSALLARVDADDTQLPTPQELLSELTAIDPDADDPGTGAFVGVVAALARSLDDEELSAALLEDIVAGDPLRAMVLGEMVEVLERDLPHRRARANAAWVRSVIIELNADDHTAAEPLLRRALELDPDHLGAAVAMAGYLDDRGRAGAALGYLQRLEGPGIEEGRALLTRYAQPGPAAADRNAPCPCGSGRKYKVCCQRSNGWPLAERMDWIWHKIVRFATSPVGQDVLVDAALHAGSSAALDAALEDPILVNLALFEGELLTDLCDLRGALLPADELALLRSWAEVPASVQEVLEVAPGSGLTLLDLTTGERTEVVDRSLSRQLSVGDAILAWLVPTPRGIAPSVGTLTVPDHKREELLGLLDEGPGLEDLAHWYASMHAPPRLATTDGDPLELIRRTYRVPDPDAAWAALAERLEEDGPGLLAFSEQDGQRWVMGSITREGHDLVVQVNAATRAAWFDDLIRGVVPAATIVDEERRSAADLLAGLGDDEEPEDDGGLLDLDDLDPGVRSELEAQLDAMMRAHEDSWVDTALPALSGATPREAADDPTRRDALLRLLQEFEDHAARWDSPGRPMDADRLRGLLGL